MALVACAPSKTMVVLLVKVGTKPLSGRLVSAPVLSAAAADPAGFITLSHIGCSSSGEVTTTSVVQH